MGILAKGGDFGGRYDEWESRKPAWVKRVDVEWKAAGMFVIVVQRSDGQPPNLYTSGWPEGRAIVPVDLYCWLTQHLDQGHKWLSLIKPIHEGTQQ